MSSNVENKLYCHHSKLCMLSICLEKSHLWSEHPPGFNSFEPDGLYTMQTAWASSEYHYIHTYTQTQWYRWKSRHYRIDRLLLQVIIHRPFLTYMFQAHTVSNWILLSTGLMYLPKRIYFCEVSMGLPKVIF